MGSVEAQQSHTTRWGTTMPMVSTDTTMYPMFVSVETLQMLLEAQSAGTSLGWMRPHRYVTWVVFFDCILSESYFATSLTRMQPARHSNRIIKITSMLIFIRRNFK